MSAGRRREREAFGRHAEDLAVLRLRLAGYRILRRRWRTPAGEVDIIARRGRLLAAVEVKARPTVAAGLEAVTPRQRRRIARAAAQFLARQPDAARLGLRFDVVVVTPWRLPAHVVDAWRPEPDWL